MERPFNQLITAQQKLVDHAAGEDQDHKSPAVDCTGFSAIYGRLPLYFQDETFATRAAIPPPKHSDSLQAVPLPEDRSVDFDLASQESCFLETEIPRLLSDSSAHNNVI
jgi:hypothetical protein